MWRSSWMATAAGPALVVSTASAAIAPAWSGSAMCWTVVGPMAWQPSPCSPSAARTGSVRPRRSVASWDCLPITSEENSASWCAGMCGCASWARANASVPALFVVLIGWRRRPPAVVCSSIWPLITAVAGISPARRGHWRSRCTPENCRPPISTRPRSNAVSALPMFRRPICASARPVSSD